MYIIILQPQHTTGKSKEKLSEALKSCNEILKELFSKKHSVIKYKSYINNNKYLIIIIFIIFILLIYRDMHGPSISQLMLNS